MANFDSGVKRYIKTYAVVKVDFPVDWKDNPDICCAKCPYLSSNDRMCQLNKSPIAYPHKYVGDNCPLMPIEGEGEQNV